ncbi:MAG TPA: RluA family pseudouridine synthase [Burkholderiales bacterium]|nr:RluA family pseudouridine synthase [Burkholderiales bacterium]
MKGLGNASRSPGPVGARTVVVDESAADQRVDNFLLRTLKGVPRSHVYRLLRGGEVRVNSRRIDATYRLQPGDRVRIPPVRVAGPVARRAPAPRDHGLPIAFEDDALLVVNKPAGLAVHGGSGISFGVIERLRAARPQARVLELAHRLDRETSGLLIVAKKRSVLTALHAALREGRVAKRYLVLVKGAWTGGARNVVLPLRKYVTSGGERRVSVEEGGQESRTRFERVRACDGFTLLAARLDTGRTHQIRVQLAHLGFPIAGDDKYGDFELNRELARRGLKRMFLHAAELELVHPTAGTRLALTAPLPDDLQRFLDGLAHRIPHHAAPV